MAFPISSGRRGAAFFLPEEQKSVSHECPIHDIILEWFWVASLSVKTYGKRITFSTHIPPTHGLRHVTPSRVMNCKVNTHY